MYKHIKMDIVATFIIALVASPFVATITLPVLAYAAGKEFGYERGLDKNFGWHGSIMQVGLIGVLFAFVWVNGVFGVVAALLAFMMFANGESVGCGIVQRADIKEKTDHREAVMKAFRR